MIRSSDDVRSESASGRSAISTKVKAGSSLARKRTSRPSMAFCTVPALPNMVCTTTSVRQSLGIGRVESNFGRGWGRTQRLPRYCTKLDASSEIGNRVAKMVIINSGYDASAHSDSKKTYPVRKSDRMAIAPRYTSKEYRRSIRKICSDTGGR